MERAFVFAAAVAAAFGHWVPAGVLTLAAGVIFLSSLARRKAGPAASSKKMSPQPAVVSSADPLAATESDEVFFVGAPAGLPTTPAQSLAAAEPADMEPLMFHPEPVPDSNEDFGPPPEEHLSNEELFRSHGINPDSAAPSMDNPASSWGTPQQQDLFASA